MSFTGAFIEYILHLRLYIVFKCSHLIHSNLARQVFLLTCIYKKAQMRINNCPRTHNQKISKTGFKDPVQTWDIVTSKPMCFILYHLVLRTTGNASGIKVGQWRTCQMEEAVSFQFLLALKLLVSVMQTIIPKQILKIQATAVNA